MLNKSISQLFSEYLDGRPRNEFLIIPYTDSAGNHCFGPLTVVKESNYYSVVLDGAVLVADINLPQTASIVVHSYINRKYVDLRAIDIDKKYGYCKFELAAAKKRLANPSTSGEVYAVTVTKHSALSTKCAILYQQLDNKFRSILYAPPEGTWV